MSVKSQNDEFDALDELYVRVDRLYKTAVVDDDYPEVRHEFEGALAAFIEAMKANDRFRGANRYNLVLASELGLKFDVTRRGEDVRAKGFKSSARRES